MSQLSDAIQRGIDKVNHREDLIIEDCGYSYSIKGEELNAVALRQVLSLIREGLSAMLPPEKDHIAEPSKKIVEITDDLMESPPRIEPTNYLLKELSSIRVKAYSDCLGNNSASERAGLAAVLREVNKILAEQWEQGREK